MKIAQKQTLDIGCGIYKVPGSYGIDFSPNCNPDQVVNLEEPCWDLPENTFGYDT